MENPTPSKILDYLEQVRGVSKRSSSDCIQSQDDILYFMFWMPKTYYGKGVVRFMCFLFIPLYAVVHMCCVITNFMYKYYDHSIHNLLNFFICIQILLTVLFMETTKLKIDGLRRRMEEDFWQLPCTLLHEKHKQKIHTAKVVIFLFVTSTLFMLLGNMKLRLKLHWKFITLIDKNLHWIFVTLYDLYIVGTSMLIYTYFVLFAYFIVYIKMQMELLAEYFEMLSLNAQCKNIYHKDVYHSFIHGIKHHEKLLSFCRQVYFIFSGKIVICQTLTLMMTFAMFVMFLRETPSVLVLVSAVGFLFMLSSFFMYGQLFSDAHNEFEDTLLQSKWYIWDNKSRNLFIMLLMSAQRTYSISIIPPYSVNRFFILWIYRYLYAIVTVLQSNNLKRFQST